MTNGESVTLGEVHRLLLRLEERTTQQFEAMNRQIDRLGYVSADTYVVQMAAHESRIKILEDAKTWLVRALVVSLVFPLIAAVVIAVVISGG